MQLTLEIQRKERKGERAEESCGSPRRYQEEGRRVREQRKDAAQPRDTKERRERIS